MKLKDDKRCLIIKGKEGKDYRTSLLGEPGSPSIVVLCGCALFGP